MNIAEKVRVLFTTYQGIFAGALAQRTAASARFATKVTSTSKTNTYGWLGQSAQFREWVGDRVAQIVAKFGYVIQNKTWEMTVAVPKEDIEDDEVGIYTPLVQDMGDSARQHADELVFKALYAGDANANVCYDGRPYFADNHPLTFEEDGTPITSEGAPVFSNLILPASGAPGEKWIVAACGRAIKPVLYQERKAPVFVSKTALDDETVFRTNQFTFGADKRDAVGYTLPQFAVMSRKPLTRANLEEAFRVLEKMVGDKNKSLGIVPTDLLVGPDLRAAAEDLVLTEKTDGGKSNTMYKRLELTVSPQFSA
jgi:phage major head subunit gpT-like protein